MNSKSPKLNWTHLLVAIGFVCAVFSLYGVIFSFIETGWHPFRFYEIISLIMWLGTLICSISLLKRRKIIGLTLIAIWIVISILGLLIPATT
jgi:hypothetical protein